MHSFFHTHYTNIGTWYVLIVGMLKVSAEADLYPYDSYEEFWSHC